MLFYDIRLLSKLHLFVKIAFFGIFNPKFFDHIANMLLKFGIKSAQKTSIFPKKANF